MPVRETLTFRGKTLAFPAQHHLTIALHQQIAKSLDGQWLEKDEVEAWHLRAVARVQITSHRNRKARPGWNLYFGDGFEVESEIRPSEIREIVVNDNGRARSGPHLGDSLSTIAGR